jgi:small-conductance mechanosensitive channel
MGKEAQALGKVIKGTMLTFAQFIATLLGFVVGSIMIAILVLVPKLLKNRARKNKSYVNNDFMPQEVAYSSVAIMITFLLATAAILIYFGIAPDTLVWFGITAVLWYFMGYVVYAVQKIVKERQS